MKFTIEAIATEHQKVKTGADFPQYIQNLKRLGVSHYTTWVADGNTKYFDDSDQPVQTGGKYDLLTISNEVKPDTFKMRLQLHQQGGTDYKTFCNDCAENGIEGWNIDLNAMTCTYFDTSENEVLVEIIPGGNE